MQYVTSINWISLVSLYMRHSLFGTQVSRTIPGYVTARSLCWCHCPCLWGALWFSWTSSWSAVELWGNPRYCWPQYNSLTVCGLPSSLQPPGSSPHWAAMLFSVVMPPAIQHLPWPGSKPQPTQVDEQGCCLVGELYKPTHIKQFTIRYASLCRLLPRSHCWQLPPAAQVFGKL